MAEITQAGYAYLRQQVQENWQYIEIKDNLGAVIFRISTSDPVCQWTHVPGVSILELTTTLSGSDFVSKGATLPVQVHSSCLYLESSGGAPLTPDQALKPADAIIASLEDTIVIKSQVEIPVADPLSMLSDADKLRLKNLMGWS